MADTAIPKQKARIARQPVTIADIESMDITANGVYDIPLSVAADKVSFQQKGNMVGTVEFSLTGANFAGSTAIPAQTAIGNYTTSMCKIVRVTVTSGTGRIVIAAK